jgi:sigma-B regulation protein RsbU (phosphoserine phosphatase)
MKNRGLSIKYKILLLLTLLPLLTLALYLVLAVKIFEEDKVASVFETSSASARTLSSQATTDLNSILGAAKPIIQEFISQRSFGPVSRAIFQSDPMLEWVAAFEKGTDEKFARVDISERIAGGGIRDLQSFGDITPLIMESMAKGRILRVPFKDDRVLIVERVGALGDADVRFFFDVGKSSRVGF